MASVISCSTKPKLGNSYPATLAEAQQLSVGQPPANWEYPFGYEDADIVRFVTDDLLLLGAVEGDINYWPVFGPLIMYDLQGRHEKWRVDRVRSPQAVHELFSTRPLIILRTTLGRKVSYRAFDLVNGAQQWQHDAGTECLTALGGSDGEGLTSFFELCGTDLLSISARDGATLWKSKTQDFDAEFERRLIATSGSVFVVDNRQVTAFRSADGERRWERTQSVGAPVDAAVSLDGVFVYSARKAAAYVAQDGGQRWTWKPAKGVIKLMTESAGHVYAVVQHPEKHADDIVALDRRSTHEIWRATLSGYLASPLALHKGLVYATVGHIGEETMGMVNDPIQMSVYTTRRNLVALNIQTGGESLNVELPPHPRIPPTSFYPTQIDRIAIRSDRMLVARDDHGVVAVDTASGKIIWNQPHLFTASSYSNSVQILSLFDSDTAKSYKPGGTHSFTAPQPSRQHSMAQANNEAHLAAAKRVLQDPGSSAADRNAARLTTEIYTSAEINRLKIESSFQQTQTALDLGVSMIALANAFNQAWQQQLQVGKKSAYYNGMLSMRFGAWQHSVALTGRYYLHAYPRLATVVDLDEGKRCDLNISPSAAQWYADKPMTAISPGGRWLAAVGVGLDASRYTQIKKRGLVIPNSSVILYDVASLTFKSDNPMEAVSKAKSNIALLAVEGNYSAIHTKLESGGDPNTMFSGMTALTYAVSRGDKKMVALLLAFGADVSQKNTLTDSTAYEVLSNIKDEIHRRQIRNMLDKAAQGILPPKP